MGVVPALATGCVHQRFWCMQRAARNKRINSLVCIETVCCVVCAGHGFDMRAEHDDDDIDNDDKIDYDKK